MSDIPKYRGEEDGLTNEFEQDEKILEGLQQVKDDESNLLAVNTRNSKLVSLPTIGFMSL